LRGELNRQVRVRQSATQNCRNLSSSDWAPITRSCGHGRIGPSVVMLSSPDKWFSSPSSNRDAKARAFGHGCEDPPETGGGGWGLAGSEVWRPPDLAILVDPPLMARYTRRGVDGTTKVGQGPCASSAYPGFSSIAIAVSQ